MTMTKTQARQWRFLAKNGARPAIPESVSWLFGKPGDEIKADIEHARTWDYGTTTHTCARRLVQMGLLDNDFNLTELGQQYMDRGPPEKPLR